MARRFDKEYRAWVRQPGNNLYGYPRLTYRAWLDAAKPDRELPQEREARLVLERAHKVQAAHAALLKSADDTGGVE